MRTFYVSYVWSDPGKGQYGNGCMTIDVCGKLNADQMNSLRDFIAGKTGYSQVVILNVLELEQ